MRREAINCGTAGRSKIAGILTRSKAVKALIFVNALMQLRYF